MPRVIPGIRAARAPRSFGRLAGRLVWACAVLLSVFHAALFVERVATGQLLDPVEAARWATGFALVGASLVLRRSGVSLFWGRRALVFWTLVVFLHWNALASVETPRLDDRRVDTSLVLVVLPAAGAVGAGIALGLLAVLGLTRRRDVHRPLARQFSVPSLTVAFPGVAAVLPLWARPPPAA